MRLYEEYVKNLCKGFNLRLKSCDTSLNDAYWVVLAAKLCSLIWVHPNHHRASSLSSLFLFCRETIEKIIGRPIEGKAVLDLSFYNRKSRSNTWEGIFFVVQNARVRSGSDVSPYDYMNDIRRLIS